METWFNGLSIQEQNDIIYRYCNGGILTELQLKKAYSEHKKNIDKKEIEKKALQVIDGGNVDAVINTLQKQTQLWTNDVIVEEARIASVKEDIAYNKALIEAINKLK